MLNIHFLNPSAHGHALVREHRQNCQAIKLQNQQVPLSTDKWVHTLMYRARLAVNVGIAITAHRC